MRWLAPGLNLSQSDARAQGFNLWAKFVEPSGSYQLDEIRIPLGPSLLLGSGRSGGSSREGSPMGGGSLGVDTNRSPKSQAGLPEPPYQFRCPFCGLLPSLGPQVPGSPSSLPLGVSDPASRCSSLSQGSAKGKKDVVSHCPCT